MAASSSAAVVAAFTQGTLTCSARGARARPSSRWDQPESSARMSSQSTDLLQVALRRQPSRSSPPAPTVSVRFCNPGSGTRLVAAPAGSRRSSGVTSRTSHRSSSDLLEVPVPGPPVRAAVAPAGHATSAFRGRHMVRPAGRWPTSCRPCGVVGAPWCGARNRRRSKGFRCSPGVNRTTMIAHAPTGRGFGVAPAVAVVGPGSPASSIAEIAASLLQLTPTLGPPVVSVGSSRCRSPHSRATCCVVHPVR